MAQLPSELHVCVPNRHVLACKACSAGHAFHPLGARHDRAPYIECVGVRSCSATTAVFTDQGLRGISFRAVEAASNGGAPDPASCDCWQSCRGIA